MEEAPVSFFEQIAATPLAVVVRENAWAYPALETLHIFGIALVMGGILLFDLRLLGLARDISLDALTGLIMPWVLAGIIGNIITGALLFASDAAEFAANSSFQVKLALVALALLNAAIYRAGIGRRANAFDSGVRAPPLARFHAGLSIMLWAGVVVAGRMMAYIK